MTSRLLVCWIAVGIAIGCAIGPVAPVYASDTRPVVRKLGRGLANAAAGSLEIPVTIYGMHQDQGPVAAMSWGLLIGLGRTITRTVVGVVEIVTFPVPLPRVGYEPIMQPEFLLHSEEAE